MLGGNPYIDVVADYHGNPRMDEFAQLAKWDEWVMPYGPIAAWLQHAFASLDQPWLGAYLWKALMAIAHVLTARYILHTLRLVAGERDVAIVTVARKLAITLGHFVKHGALPADAVLNAR